MEIVQNKFNTDVLRKIMFAVHHLPKDMPNYWKTIKEFASVNESSISELQTVVENMEYLYQETFATDEELRTATNMSKFSWNCPSIFQE